jgi:hypothetical protein
MRKLAVFLATLCLLTSPTAWAHDEKVQAELLDEILRLTQAEVPDHIVLEQIEAWGFAFELTADDIVELRALGVSDAVLEALVHTDNAPEYVGDDSPSVYFSAGYYSPWYYYPYAWGGYCDPFPRLYASYYYPFYYGASYFGYYGWCGSTYYAHYNPTCYRRESWHAGRGGATAPYTVAANLPSRRAADGVAPASASTQRPATTAPRVIRGRSGDRDRDMMRRGNVLRTTEAGRGSRRAADAGVAPARQSGASQSLPSRLQRDVRGRTNGQSLRTASPGSASRSASPVRSSRSWSSNSSRGRNLSMPRSSTMSRSQPSMRAQSAPRMQAPSSVGARFGAARSR